MRNITVLDAPVAISPAPSKPSLFPLNRPSSGSASPAPATRTKSKEEPRMDGMLLVNEAGLRRRNPSWPLVEQVVRELDPGDGNSFACVSLPGNTFTQTLQGRNGYHLECRLTGGSPEQYIHLRASYPGGSTEANKLVKHDFTSPGEHRDLLCLEDVLDAFRAFHGGEGLPGWLEWRDMGI